MCCSRLNAVPSPSDDRAIMSSMLFDVRFVSIRNIEAYTPQRYAQASKPGTMTNQKSLEQGAS